MTKTAGVAAHNCVHLVGVLTTDAEPRELPSGTPIVRFRMVVARDSTPMTTGSKVRSDWFECSAWAPATRRKVARLKKGDAVEVEGAVRRRHLRGATAGASLVEIEVQQVRRLVA